MLSNRAAQLPEVAIKKPQHIIGKNTVEGMQSGVGLWLYWFNRETD